MEKTLASLIEHRLSRRQFIGGALVGGAALYVTTAMPAWAKSTSLPLHTVDAVELLPDYQYQVIAAWGDAVTATETFGYNCDYNAYMPIKGSSAQGLLCTNHENTNIKNKSYFKFVLIRGIETISHVFNTLLYYTKNLDVSYYNSQKALYFYVEFICQIFDTQHTYLKLSSRDAVMYVYKKTLFELHNEKKKTMFGLDDEDKEKHDMLGVYNKLYKHIVFYILNYNEFLQQNNKDVIQGILAIFEKLCEKLNVSCGHDLGKITSVYQFSQTISSFDNLNIESYLELLSLFSKKIAKKAVNKTKLQDPDPMVDVVNGEAYLDWLFT